MTKCCGRKVESYYVDYGWIITKKGPVHLGWEKGLRCNLCGRIRIRDKLNNVEFRACAPLTEEQFLEYMLEIIKDEYEACLN